MYRLDAAALTLSLTSYQEAMTAGGSSIEANNLAATADPEHLAVGRAWRFDRQAAVSAALETARTGAVEALIGPDDGPGIVDCGRAPCLGFGEVYD
jgi:hypothetical protein